VGYVGIFVNALAVLAGLVKSGTGLKKLLLIVAGVKPINAVASAKPVCVIGAGIIIIIVVIIILGAGSVQTRA
jgi:hypothetical protein